MMNKFLINFMHLLLAEIIWHSFSIKKLNFLSKVILTDLKLVPWVQFVLQSAY